MSEQCGLIIESEMTSFNYRINGIRLKETVIRRTVIRRYHSFITIIQHPSFSKRKPTQIIYARFYK